jgi:hypothetical protein
MKITINACTNDIYLQKMKPRMLCTADIQTLHLEQQS